MSYTNILILILYSLGLSAGQFMFKISAGNLPKTDVSSKVAYLLFSPAFLAAMFLYLFLSCIWVWILSFIPISRAYPFVAISIVCTPILTAIYFKEPIETNLFIGLFFVLLGLFFMVKE